MAVRQVLATRPAAGADWSFVVPAQWLPYLYGVTATLTTATAVTGFPDETGNGHTATLVGTHNNPLGAAGPYAAGPNNYSVFGDGATTANNNIANAAANAAFAATPGTIECLLNLPTHVTGKTEGNGLCVMDNGGTVVRVGIGTDQSGITDPVNITMTSNGGFRAIVGAPTMSRNVWHSLALTWDGVTFTVYLDGVSVGTHAGDQPAWALPFVACAGQALNNPPYGWNAANAFYGAALSAAQLAAHFAARSSWTAYRTAVLADTPVAFWGLNTIPSGPSRTVTLKITDGTRTVAQFPANFAAASADSFVWSWQALGPGAQSSTDGKINSVPIPEVSVDAGYVISSQTLDIAGTDQWGPIVLWFDDGTGPVGPGGQLADATYFNALLVPDYSHRGG